MPRKFKVKRDAINQCLGLKRNFRHWSDDCWGYFTFSTIRYVADNYSQIVLRDHGKNYGVSIYYARASVDDFSEALRGKTL